MDRRTLISSGVAAVAAGVFVTQASAQAAPTAAPNSMPNAKLRDAIARCLKSGELCSGMCVKEVSKGSKEFGECLMTLQDMLATCAATLSLVSYESKLAKRAASLCADACNACKLACGKHKGHFAHGMHLECKDCMDSCEECEKLCREFAA